MKVLILTVGSRGDVQPYLAIASGLKAAGHDVAICTCPRFQALIESYGICFFHLDEGLLELLDSSFGRALVGNLNGVISVLRSIPRVLKLVGPIHRRMVDDSWKATDAFDPDVIVFHPKMFCAPAFAAKRKIPAIAAPLVPMLVPTGETPFFGFPRLPLGRIYNRGTYQLLQQLTKLGTRGYLREWRKRHDPEGVSLPSGPTQTSPGSPVPVLHGYSEAVCPRPKDWPAYATVTGYWFLSSNEVKQPSWEPSQALNQFLSSGPAPIYIGFGSMAV